MKIIGARDTRVVNTRCSPSRGDSAQAVGRSYDLCRGDTPQTKLDGVVLRGTEDRVSEKTREEGRNLRKEQIN